MDSQLLRGARVVEVHGDFTPVSVQYAGYLLRMLGAQVDIVQVPSGFGEHGERHGTIESFLANGKTVVSVPGVDGVADLVGRTRPNVVLVGSFGGDENRFVREVTAQAHAGNSAATAVAITPFGLSGPKAHWRGSNLTALSAGGSAFYQPAGCEDSEDEQPLQIGQYTADFLAGASAVVAAIAGIQETERGGTVADVSVHDCVLSMGLLNTAWVTHDGRAPGREGRRGSLGLLRCADGLISLLMVQEAQWQHWVEVMGSPSWASAPIFSDRQHRNEHLDVLKQLIEEWAQNYTKEQIWRMGQAALVPVFPVHTIAEVVADRQMASRHFFEPLDAASPSEGRVPANVFGHITTTEPNGGTATHRQGVRGIKVLDLSWVLAGPHCTTWLGYLGADVVRVESRARLDQFRAGGPAWNGSKDPDEAGSFHHINQNKRSAAINLVKREARDLILRLAEQADVLVENFGAGQMERFGLSESALRSRNPSLIIASSSGLGRSGPDAEMRAYGNTIHAYSGLAGRAGYSPDDVRGVNGTWVDPLTGVFQTIAIMAAVSNRDRTGEGATIDLSMSEVSVAGTILDAFVDLAHGELDPTLPENRSHSHLLNDTFLSKDWGHWVAISVETQHDLAALWNVLAIPASDASEADPVQRDAVVMAVRQCDPEELVARLQEAGIAAERANDAALAIRDEHAVARGMVRTVVDSQGRSYPIAAMPWQRLEGADGAREWPLVAAPRLGEHTNEVLTEWLGMDQSELRALAEAGVLE